MDYNFAATLEQLAKDMCEELKSQPNATPIETRDYGWENYRFKSPKMRQGHVEFYRHNNLVVLHCVVLPDVKRATPIFGADVIVSEKSNTVSGIFLDWSPTYTDFAWCDISYSKENERIKPEWAHIFSEQFIALRPDNDNANLILEQISLSLSRYLRVLDSSTEITRDDVLQIVHGKQTEYCEVQALNPRTRAALLHHLQDEQLVNEFMETILFPVP